MRQVILMSAAAVLAGIVAAVAAQQPEDASKDVLGVRGTEPPRAGEVFRTEDGAILYGVLPNQRVFVNYDGDQRVGALATHAVARARTNVDID
ncbi:hypothetical protein OSH11_13450 [Kaistia dalseonensis]|uniref:Uncharacterized protein n=1 Tax=Kaistia dalseonensis TaxID=410840 RepID=A0ABU0HA23_9HYPH|nr:hypothetical protein [Kaistia dalseonensis]MCX5495715.1 hypothetical protein [Kaistia dalseonensis]MDQ0438311.1 hypothetical protein [Kaistia dalseonensis]